ncbi:hypothetical protein [uncultured Chryseobacterium sp.]|uniref:hypothetical protein n=1 Tax=uncultured Chryseobacterium sp. TaxID=259322 RepID=UPI0025CFE05E|nr:hypothetical protein [uncultured Chryseobacterium sp.]
MKADLEIMEEVFKIQKSLNKILKATGYDRFELEVKDSEISAISTKLFEDAMINIAKLVESSKS